MFATTVDKQAVDEQAGLRQDGVPERRGDATAALVAAATAVGIGLDAAGAFSGTHAEDAAVTATYPVLGFRRR